MIKSNAVQVAFSKASESYDLHTPVQEALGEILMDSLEQDNVSDILELGSATGRDTMLLRQRFPEAAITAIDFSESMIAVAQEKGLNSVDFRSEDARDFLRDRDSITSYDLIFSNATLQWLPSLPEFFTSVADALSTGGYFVGSVFGSETFSELQSALKAVFGKDVSIAANEFLGQEALTTALSGVFSEVSIDEQLFHLHFDSLQELLYSLKQGGVTAGSSMKGLWTPRRFADLDDYFMAEYSGFSLSYQAFLIKGVVR